MDNDAIRNTLRAAGVPRDAFTTTLEREGMLSLRESMRDSVANHKNLYLYPAMQKSGTANKEKTDLCFFLVAKELVLGNHEVFCCTLVDLQVALIEDSEESASLLGRLSESEVIAIRGFHDRGGRVEPFLSMYDMHYVISWMIRKYEDGAIFVLEGAAPFTEAAEWWPESFIGYLRSRTTEYMVAGGRAA